VRDLPDGHAQARQRPRLHCRRQQRFDFFLMTFVLMICVIMTFVLMIFVIITFVLMIFVIMTFVLMTFVLRTVVLMFLF
jgi:Flp pilus assembly protein TadB